jgi:hypothetical protein
MNKIAIIGIIIAAVIIGVILFYQSNNLATDEKTPNIVNIKTPEPTGKHYTILLNESMGMRNP